MSEHKTPRDHHPWCLPDTTRLAAAEAVFTLSDAWSFSGLKSKISSLGSMLNFDANVKKTTARHQCENRLTQHWIDEADTRERPTMVRKLIRAFCEGKNLQYSFHDLHLIRQLEHPRDNTFDGPSVTIENPISGQKAQFIGSMPWILKTLLAQQSVRVKNCLLKKKLSAN